MAKYDYNKPHFLVIGPDAVRFDPAASWDEEHCREVVSEAGLYRGYYVQPDLKVLSVERDAKGSLHTHEVTDIWFADLFSEYEALNASEARSSDWNETAFELAKEGV